MALRSSIVLALLAAPVAVVAQPARPPLEAGFETGRLADGTDLGIWYPAVGTTTDVRTGIYQHRVVGEAVPAGKALPLVIISHGSGSSNLAHSDTATALARAGFVVVAVTHPGDNWRDQSRSTDLPQRLRTVSLAISHMLEGWPHAGRIDRKRIGAFGYSAGGFTVLAAAGGVPDLAQIAPHCARVPQAFECALVKGRTASPPPWTSAPDRRIKALVVAAPALGYTFGRDGLRGVQVPVQLWRADADRLLPAPHYADAVRASLPRKPDFHGEPAAGHFDFMAPCVPGSPPLPICQGPGFDRAAFHERFNAAIVRFFKQRL